jgi:hypothetical protein
MRVRRFALPDNGNAPAHALQLRFNEFISCNIAFKLSVPELNI